MALTESKNRVRTAVIGLGSRGQSILDGLLLGIDNVKVTAVCDTYADRTENGVRSVERAYGETPFATTDYREAVCREDVDAVLILSAWESHVPVALAAMEQGKAVGMEVGGAYSVEDCWSLVHTQEGTGVPFMFLENCCYGQVEMTVLHMVRQGLFGEVVHASGGYCHDLRSEIAYGRENRHYRLRNYLTRNCDNYPTHELGPIAQILGINRGNRMLSLVSMSSKAAGLNGYAACNPGVDPSLRTARVNQGDIVNTLIRCANGETISLTLDTTLPRPYSRGFTIRGTRGMYTEDNHSMYLDTDFSEKDHWNWSPNWGNAEKYMEMYRHPVWVDYLQNGIRGGHGGMDGLVYDAFFEAVRKGEPCPIDVYDAAAWMCITPLSEQSIAMGSQPVAIPDFTRGAFCVRKPVQ